MTSLEFSVRHVGGVNTREKFTSVRLVVLNLFAIYLNMPGFCLALNCSNDKSKRKDLSFCRVPKVIKNQGGEMEILSSERRR